MRVFHLRDDGRADGDAGTFHGNARVIHVAEFGRAGEIDEMKLDFQAVVEGIVSGQRVRGPVTKTGSAHQQRRAGQIASNDLQRAGQYFARRARQAAARLSLLEVKDCKAI